MHRDLTEDMRRFGHLAQRSQLFELGHSERAVRAAVAERSITVLRRPWLATPAALPSAVRAVTLGGKLAGPSALRSYGVWVGRNPGLWVCAPPHASRLAPTGPGEHRLSVPELFSPADHIRWRVSVGDALLHAFRRADALDAIASLESARYMGLIDDLVVRQLQQHVPRPLRRRIERSTRRAMSGIETLFRLAAEAEGWNVQIQVSITGVGHVDVLIDGWLVIELDGGSHAEPQQMHVDRRRDAELILLGYRYHRFDYRLLMNDMARCIAVTRRILAQGRPMAAR